MENIASYITVNGKKAKLKVKHNGTWVEYAPVIHAKWVSRPGTLGDWYCSNCEGEILYEVETYGGGNYHDINTVWSSYCPYCGARMDLED